MSRISAQTIGVETLRAGTVRLPGGAIVSQLPPIPCYYVTSGGTYYVTSDGSYYMVKVRMKKPKS